MQYNQEIASNAVSEIKQNSMAILDSGATSNCFTTNAPVRNIRPTCCPLEVKIPDGKLLKSTHTADLEIEGLPPQAKQGHLIPGMKGHSLVSLVQLCRAGCVVYMDNDKLSVGYQGKVVIRGMKCPRTSLWLVPLTKTSSQANQTSQQTGEQSASNVYHTSSRSEWIQYLHQACFSPVSSTWCKAIDNDQFLGWPGLTSKAVKKHLPASTATVKGHMVRPKQGIRSTTKPKRVNKKQVEQKLVGTIDLNNKDNKEIKDKVRQLAAAIRGKASINEVNNMNGANEMDADMNPTEQANAACHLFVGATIGDQNDNTLYGDQTGRFPVQSFKGNNYIFVAYVYGPNAIIVRPIKNRSDASMVEAYQDVYKYLEDRGFKPQFNVTDNKCSKAIKDFLKQQQATIQIVEPDNHRVNAAERAIQTFKNHFIAGLSTVDKNFPMQLWDQLLPQAQDTLNLLRMSRTNNKLSAYAVLEGHFNFNKTPMAPPGTKAIVYSDPSNRTSWGVHGEDAWYVGPAKEHYRCYKFFMPATKAFRITQAAMFYPSHCKMPQVSPADTI